LSFPHERFGYHVVYDRDVYDAIDFASAHGFGRRGIRERMRLCLELARDLEAERFTIHPSQPPNFACGGGPGTYLEDHRDIYANALRKCMSWIASTAEGVQVCVENEPFTPFIEDVLEGLLAEEGNLFLTLDAPKARSPSKGAPVERVEGFYKRHVNRVREVHLHDRRPGGRFHDVLGYGEVDVRRHLHTMAPHDVHFTLEIRPREKAYESLLWLERLWNEMF